MFHIYVTLLHCHLCKNLGRWTLISLSFCKFQIIFCRFIVHMAIDHTPHTHTKTAAQLHVHLPENGIIGGVDPQPNLINLQLGLVRSDLWLFISGSWVGKSDISECVPFYVYMGIGSKFVTSKLDSLKMTKLSHLLVSHMWARPVCFWSPVEPSYTFYDFAKITYFFLVK